MNQVAVVTGGAGGIGQAVAERLAKDNYALVVLDMNDEAGKQVVSEFCERGIEASFHRADLTQETEVQTAFEKINAAHGHIDVLVNVAGGSMHRHRLEELSLDHWRSVVDANLNLDFSLLSRCGGPDERSEVRRDCQYFFGHRVQRQ